MILLHSHSLCVDLPLDSHAAVVAYTVNRRRSLSILISQKSSGQAALGSAKTHALWLSAANISHRDFNGHV